MVIDLNQARRNRSKANAAPNCETSRYARSKISSGSKGKRVRNDTASETPELALIMGASGRAPSILETQKTS